MNIIKINSLQESLSEAIRSLEWGKTFATQEDAKHAVECYENMSNDAVRAMEDVRLKLQYALLPEDLSERELGIFKDGFLLGWRELDSLHRCGGECAFPTEVRLKSVFNATYSK